MLCEQSMSTLGTRTLYGNTVHLQFEVARLSGSLDLDGGFYLYRSGSDLHHVEGIRNPNE